jgi:hypothetical protein
VPTKCPASEVGLDWDPHGKKLCEWFRLIRNERSELVEWVTKELGGTVDDQRVQMFVDNFPWHLGPKKAPEKMNGGHSW